MPIEVCHVMHPIGPGLTSVGKTLGLVGGDNEIDVIVQAGPDHRGDGQVVTAVVEDAAHTISLEGRHQFALLCDGAFETNDVAKRTHRSVRRDYAASGSGHRKQAKKGQAKKGQAKKGKFPIWTVSEPN